MRVSWAILVRLEAIPVSRSRQPSKPPSPAATVLEVAQRYANAEGDDEWEDAREELEEAVRRWMEGDSGGGNG